MANDQYHVRVETTFACGCNVASAIELPVGMEPDGQVIAIALLTQVTDSDYLSLIADDRHVEHGNERVTIELRTMVGPIPEDL